MEDQGMHFYVNRYLVGLPDEPKYTSDITASHWIWNPALQHIVSAIGLAGLSNLTGNTGKTHLTAVPSPDTFHLTSHSDDGRSP